MILLIAATGGVLTSTASATKFDSKISAPVNGKASLLVRELVELDTSGFERNILVRVKTPAGRIMKFSSRSIPHGGTLRRADRRKNFRFVHAVPLNRAATRSLLKKPGRTRISLRISHRRPVALEDSESGSGRGSGFGVVKRAGARVCSSAPMLRLAAKPGSTTRRALPSCGSRVTWNLGKRPDQGKVRVNGRRFMFTQDKGQAGADEFELVARDTSNRVVARRKVQLRISATPANSISVRAMGDSVTAGFGYYGKTGKLMPITSLLSCEPGATIYNDACSSNSSNRNNKGSNPNYLEDFGLSRNISWAAQWANEYGITEYGNYAISGSAPVDWLPGGQFDKTRQLIEQVNPDYILMTMGANPLLSDMLFGVDEMGCAIESDLFGGYRECIEAAFASVNLSGRLNALYQQLIDNTSSRIIVMQYHLSIPSSGIAYSAAQIELMGELMNEIIAFEANTVSPERINVIAPPRFDVGIDMTPLYPAKYSCSWFDWKVDGPSVQADPSQDFLEALHPLSFCAGPAIGKPWVISGDTGIHPSAVGYSRMASQIPAPE